MEELINQYRYLVGGYYGVSLIDEYPIKEYILKDIEEYIKDFIEVNPIDNFNYKINGGSKKLGIMQVESKKFITDSESINITYKKITKLYDRYNKKKDKNVSIKVLDDYLKEESNNVKYIYEVIKKF